MLSVLRHRDYRLLFLGGVVSSLGDYFLFIALPFYVYSLTGSALATGGTFIAQSLPSILFGSLVGVFVDRWDRRRTMAISDLLRAILLLGLLAVHSGATVWIVFAVSFAQATIGQFFNPSRDALIPRLVGGKDLLAANSLTSMGAQLTMLVGPALGGAALALFGMSSAILVDSASFLFSASMAVLVASPPRDAPTSRSADSRSAWETVWHEYRAGVSLMRRNRVVTALLLAMGIAQLGQGLINVQVIPWVKDVLHGDALVLGWIISAQGIGGLFGGLALGALGKSLSPSKVVAAGLVLDGLLVVSAVSLVVIPVILLLVACIGVVVVVSFVRIQTLLQMAVGDAYRGRVLGAYGTTQSALLLVGMSLAGALGGAIGPVRTLELAGMIYAIAGVTAASVLSRALRGAPPDAASVEVSPSS